MKKRITIKDIAEKAGVTKATVSMVMSNDKRITEATKEKVMKIVKSLNYYPDESARRLAKGKTDSIAFIAPRFTSPFVFSFLNIFESLAFATGKYKNGVLPYSTGNNAAAKEELLREILYSKRADAVVVITIKPSRKIVAEYAKNEIPLLLVETQMKGAHSVGIDNEEAAHNATGYLIKKWGKNIGLIVGEIDTAPKADPNIVSMERIKGYKRALNDHGVNFDKNKIMYIRNHSYDDGRKCMLHFIRNKIKLDGIFCAAGDVVAMGVMDQAKKSGFKIPQDLAIIGFDDVVAAKLLNPALTTIKQPFDEIGKMIYDITIDSIEGKSKEEKHIIIKSELIIRESA
jgi:LacI family transcriptional regulator